MDAEPKQLAEAIDGTISALRYTLWAAERAAVLAAGGTDDDVPLCPVDKLDGLALADLVIGARRQLAAAQDITDPAAQHEFARCALLGELESLELSASFAAVDAEFAEEPPPGG